MKREQRLPTRYDEYEISGVREYGSRPDGFCEQVDDAEAQFWSLYGHIPGEGVECIGDFKTRQHAETVYYRITGRPYDTMPAKAKCSNDETGVSHTGQERIPPMNADPCLEGPHAERALYIAYLHRSFIRLEEFGCVVSLSEDQSAIFICEMNVDGSLVQHPGHPEWDWILVSDPVPNFLEKVNEIFGTTFRYEDFGMS